MGKISPPRQRGAKVAVIGISLGGAAALLGDRGPLPADALVLQAVYPDIRHAIRNRIADLSFAPAGWLLEPLLSLQAKPRFGVWPACLSPIAAAHRYPGPALVVGGGADRYTPPAETKVLFDALPGPKALWLAPGLAHAEVSDVATPAYRTRLRAFLLRAIGAP